MLNYLKLYALRDANLPNDLWIFTMRFHKILLLLNFSQDVQKTHQGYDKLLLMLNTNSFLLLFTIFLVLIFPYIAIAIAIIIIVINL